jgi:DNA-binding beta-propeller fold protein YncE
VNRRLSFAPPFTALIVLLVAAAPALAKPPGGYLNEKGVVTPGQLQAPPRAILGPPGSNAVYVTQPTDDGTALARVDTTDNATVRSRLIASGFAIPTVAVDKSTSGLSADGSTLALAGPLSQLRQRTTQFKVLDAKSLRIRNTITLRGSYSFDAISPDGNLIYLIQYTAPPDPSQYLVRAYSVQARHLLQAPVIDPSEAGQPMTGRPATRAMSPNGQWAYTLYQGSDEGPFVHALDTSGHKAVCVDLDGLTLPQHLSGSQLAVNSDGSQLTITRDGSQLGTIDTHTFAVSPPPAPSDGHGFPWILIAILALVAAAGAGIMSRVLRRRRGLASG